MPYKDKERQKQYQLKRYHRIRSEWFSKNGPCIDCGNGDNLELDHVNPTTKISHRIWSWSEERRTNELSKCVVRCKPCHKIKTIRNREFLYREKSGNAKLTEMDVQEILRRFKDGNSQASIADDFGVTRYIVNKIVNGNRWKYLGS